MPSLTPNIENRVRKLPKPSNATQGLQPLFEAVSNAVFAIEDGINESVSSGIVRIAITSLEMRNRATIHAAGMSRKRPTNFQFKVRSVPAHETD